MTTSAAITTAPYEELAAGVRGSLIMPGDPEYDQARAVYNGMIDKHPAAIVRVRDQNLLAAGRLTQTMATSTSANV